MEAQETAFVTEADCVLGETRDKVEETVEHRV